MTDVANMSQAELIEKLNEACRMAVEERAAAFRLVRAMERQDAELTALRRRVQSLQADLDEERSR